MIDDKQLSIAIDIILFVLVISAPIPVLLGIHKPERSQLMHMWDVQAEARAWAICARKRAHALAKRTLACICTWCGWEEHIPPCDVVSRRGHWHSTVPQHELSWYRESRRWERFDSFALCGILRQGSEVHKCSVWSRPVGDRGRGEQIQFHCASMLHCVYLSFFLETNASMKLSVYDILHGHFPGLQQLPDLYSSTYIQSYFRNRQQRQNRELYQRTSPSSSPSSMMVTQPHRCQNELTSSASYWASTHRPLRLHFGIAVHRTPTASTRTLPHIFSTFYCSLIPARSHDRICYPPTQSELSQAPRCNVPCTLLGENERRRPRFCLVCAIAMRAS